MDQILPLNTDYSWVKDYKIEHIFMIMHLEHSEVLFGRSCLVNTETLLSSDSDDDINTCKKPICSF